MVTPTDPTFVPVCALPPPGWWCSRAGGHEGPCALDLDGALWKVTDVSFVTPSLVGDDSAFEAWLSVRGRLLARDVFYRELGAVGVLDVSLDRERFPLSRPHLPDRPRWVRLLEALHLRAVPPLVQPKPATFLRLAVWCARCTCLAAEDHEPPCPASFPLDQHREARRRREVLEAAWDDGNALGDEPTCPGCGSASPLHAADCPALEVPG